MTIESELLALKSHSGEFLKAEDVVEWAWKHKQSALHKQFEWDDGVAANEYRIWQARRLIALHIVNVDGVRELVSLSIDRSLPGGGYRSLQDVLSDQKLHEIMLDDALRELERVKAKYDQLKALKPIWSAMAKVASKRKGRERRKGGGEARISAAG